MAEKKQSPQQIFSTQDTDPTLKKTSQALKEEELVKFWEEHHIFQKTISKKAPHGNYVFFDGPPFATGLPHYGHILASTIKDAVPRYWTMKGFCVHRRWGWDTHGLPIENIVEKDLKISGRKQIEEYGVEKFNEYARSKVLDFVHEWKRTVDRIARWVDFDGSYMTMDNTFIESVWWALKELYNKDLVYEGTRVLPYCPRCETPIANSEIAMDNSYKDITDISVYVRFRKADDKITSFLVWTTTPWTLPGNFALAVNPSVDYITVETGEEGSRENLILAKPLYEKHLSKFVNPIILSEVKGQELVGTAYVPPFRYFFDSKTINKDKAWKVYAGEFVTITDGVGIVHIAPGYGEDDMQLAKKEGIPFVHHVTLEGKFNEKVTDFAGIPVKPKDNHQSADILIIKYLAALGILFAKEKIIHSYPHCFRCETPLIYYAIPAWFIKISDVKPRLIELNEKINWIPDHLKEGRFKKSVENAPDWNISRNRFWASPLPIWKCSQCNTVEVIGSIEELKQKTGKVPTNVKGEVDLHRPYIDSLVYKCSCGGDFKRIPEVIDCWFESGSMPFAQSHYPFENKEWFNQNFPSDFVAEYIAQTRTWFYYMLAISTMLFDAVPFKNVITTGTVLAEDGQKMSKSKGNFPDPWILFNKYGVDALRFYLLSSPLMKSEDLNFSEKDVDTVSKKIILRLNNIVTFFELYKQQAKNPQYINSKNILDLWICARLNELIKVTTGAMDTYKLDQAVRPFEAFIDDFSTWYLRRSRERLKGQDEEDKNRALVTMGFVLKELAKLLAPFTPFIAEDIYQKVRSADDPESVHLENWPLNQQINQSVIDDMNVARQIVEVALALRAENKIKIRQPLSELILNSKKYTLSKEYLDVVRDEINVKKIVFDQTLEDDISATLDLVITPELRGEGNVREFIRVVQDIRKKMLLNFADTVTLTIKSNNDGKMFLDKFDTDIKNATQTDTIIFQDNDGENIEIDGMVFVLTVNKSGGI